MLRRVLQATVGTVLLAVLMLGIPLAHSWLQISERDLNAELENIAYRATISIDARLASGQPVDASAFDAVLGTYPDLSLYIYASGEDFGEVTVGRDPGEVRQTVRQTGSFGETVIVKIPDSDVNARVTSAWALIVVAALAALAVGVSIALWQSQRLTAPLAALTRRAEELGSGRGRGAWKPSGISEIDMVAHELSKSGAMLSERLEAERTLASDASHQLRTPLTALSMRLDEILAISSEEEVREEARISLEQIDRLTTVVHDLINAPRASSRRTPGVVDLRAVLTQQSEEWSPAFKAARRELVMQVPRSVSVWASVGPLTQVIATLIENSLVHGGGRTLVRVRSAAKSTVIEVSDQGRGVDPALGKRVFERSVSGAESQGTGVGLALARTLVEDDGGRLELLQEKPAVFGVFLITAPSPEEPDPAPDPGRRHGADRGRRTRPRRPRISGYPA